jgi:hypothetical protein
MEQAPCSRMVRSGAGQAKPDCNSMREQRHGEAVVRPRPVRRRRLSAAGDREPGQILECRRQDAKERYPPQPHESR